jgi:cell wall-associated NlpC family hydrolase
MLGLLAGAALTGLGGRREAAAARLSKGRQIVREAKQHIGDQYVVGGTGPQSFDCSGFTFYVVKQALGVDISPDLQTQTQVGRHVGKGRRREGDLIFFNIGGPRVTHVAIVTGKNQVIHAMNPQDGVRASDISSAYYQNHIHSVRRL